MRIRLVSSRATYLDNQLDAGLVPGAVLDELERHKVGVLDLGHFPQAPLRSTDFLEDFFPLCIAPELDRRLHHTAGVVLEGDLPHLSADEVHHLLHEFLGVLFGVGLHPELVPQGLGLRDGLGVAAGRLAFLSHQPLLGAAGKLPGFPAIVFVFVLAFVPVFVLFAGEGVFVVSPGRLSLGGAFLCCHGGSCVLPAPEVGLFVGWLVLSFVRGIPAVWMLCGYAGMLSLSRNERTESVGWVK